MNKISVLSLSALATMTATASIIYPKAPSSKTVDSYFDMTVEDPYRPLENDTAAATLRWVEEENAITEAFLSKFPMRENIKNRLTQLNNYTKRGLPSKENDGRYYFSLNSGLQNQAVIYRSNTLDGEAELFIDPNTLSDDGTVALTGIFMSEDGKYTAYTISRSGSDWTEIYVIDTETGHLLDDHIKWAKFTGAIWFGDGFFYSAYDQPVAGKEFSNANENHRIYYHKIGTPQSEDTLFFSDPKNHLHFHRISIPEGTKYGILSTGGQGFGEAISIKNLETDGPWMIMEPTQDVTISIIGVKNGLLYFTTSLDAPNSRVMVTPVDKPGRENWQELIPQSANVLSSAQFAGDKLLLTYSKDASSQAFVFGLDGKLIRPINIGGIGSVGFSSSPKTDDVFYTVNSYLTPWAHYRYDLNTGESTLMESAEIEGFNPDDYITEDIFFPSADGTMIHGFMTRRKDIRPDGLNPLHLYGYGGFDISLNPSFSPSRALWLENGGISVVANLRGGSEYGDQWHEAGTKLQKKNVFNDFIAAAEYMIDKGWTSPELIAIEGGSNGGLLVGAVTNMRPDLFAVAIPEVGVMDMLRYHLFTIGWNWASDYGTSADSPEMADYLRSYSPAHNVRNDGTRYPAVLVTTADHDDRVVPAHSFKYIAALQAANTGDRPKLIRVETKAGHGSGKPLAKRIAEAADIYTFIYGNMGINPYK